MELNGCYSTKVNSKAFAVTILTVSVSNIVQSEQGQEIFRINFCAIATIEFHSSSYLQYFHSLTCLHSLLTFDPYSFI